MATTHRTTRTRPDQREPRQASDTSVDRRGDDGPRGGVLHAVTWAVWATCAAAVAQLAPNPLYTLLVIAAAWIVASAHRRDAVAASSFRMLTTVGVVFAVLRVALTALTTHGGAHVWMTLPAVRLPTILGGFTVGGTIEGPVVAHAMTEGLAIVAVLAAFGAFNAVASHHELVAAAPRAFHEAGLVLTIALAFVPSTLAAVTATREAERARTGSGGGGSGARRGRLVRLVIPVLEQGLERAVHLAESMDARGYARRRAERHEAVAAWCGVASLAALGGAFVALVGTATDVAMILGVLGGGLLATAVRVIGRSEGATRYRPRTRSRLDLLVALGSMSVVAMLVALPHLGVTSLDWSPASWTAPRFDPLIGLGVLALALPALLGTTPCIADQGVHR